MFAPEQAWNWLTGLARNSRLKLKAQAVQRGSLWPTAARPALTQNPMEQLLARRTKPAAQLAIAENAKQEPAIFSMGLACDQRPSDGEHPNRKGNGSRIEAGSLDRPVLFHEVDPRRICDCSDWRGFFAGDVALALE